MDIIIDGFTVSIDDEDYWMIEKWHWMVRQLSKTAKRSYLIRKEHGKSILFHREVNKTPPGMVTDHIDHNTLNNKKSNLRTCTHGQNACNRELMRVNTSGYKGVCRSDSKHGWRARIKVNHQEIYLGAYKTKQEAYEAYRKAAIEIHGEYASL